MRWISFLISLAITACVAQKDRGSDLKAAPISQPVRDKADPLDYEFIKQMVVENDLVSIDELLEILSTSAQGKVLLDQAVFVFAGTGDIHSSKDAPRIILFNRDASLIVSYGTDTPSDEEDSLQIISYDSQRQVFMFREILFPAVDFGGAIQYADGAKSIDSDRCVSCHAIDGRPVWEKPPVWPGIYGGVGTIQPATTEYDGIRGILSFASLNERFQYLTQLKPWFDKDLFAEPEPVDIRIGKTNANDLFHNRVTRLNSKRIVRMIGESEDHNRYRHAILSVLADCSDMFIESLPERETSRIEIEWDEILAETKLQIDEYHSNKLASLDGFGVSLTSMSRTEQGALADKKLHQTANQIARLRVLLERRAKAPVIMADWATTPNPSYTFLVNQGTDYDLAGYYFMKHFHDDPQMGSMHREIGARHKFAWEASAVEFNRYLKENRTAVCDAID